MNSAVGPIFNEKVDFVGPVNSAQVHCSQKTGSTVAAGENKKNKKKKGRKLET